jgi:hypothetical protein
VQSCVHVHGEFQGRAAATDNLKVLALLHQHIGIAQRVLATSDIKIGSLELEPILHQTLPEPADRYIYSHHKSEFVMVHFQDDDICQRLNLENWIRTPNHNRCQKPIVGNKLD